MGSLGAWLLIKMQFGIWVLGGIGTAVRGYIFRNILCLQPLWPSQRKCEIKRYWKYFSFLARLAADEVFV